MLRKVFVLFASASHSIDIFMKDGIHLREREHALIQNACCKNNFGF